MRGMCDPAFARRNVASMDIPQINAAVGAEPVLSVDEAEAVRTYYAGDLQL